MYLQKATLQTIRERENYLNSLSDLTQTTPNQITNILHQSKSPTSKPQIKIQMVEKKCTNQKLKPHKT